MARGKNKHQAQVAWRPNFRNQDLLPDIKVIRTDFLLNLVSISLAIVVLSLLIFREYRIHVVSTSVKNLETNIADNAATNKAAVKLSSEFGKIEKSVKELPDFKNVPVVMDQLLFSLSELQPQEMVLSSINFSPTTVRVGRNELVKYILTLSGTVTDSIDPSASTVISEYRAALPELEVFKSYFESSELSSFSRNAALGYFDFTIRVTLNETPIKEDKKK